MDVDRSSTCASARRGEGGERQQTEDQKTGVQKRKRERKDTRRRSHSRGRVKRRVKKKTEGEREREGGERGGGWPFDEHGGPSMDVRRGPWRHTCTSPRHPGESKQPYKVAGLRFNPKFISSISKGLSRGPERVSERLTRTTLPSPTPPRCSPSCLA